MPIVSVNSWFGTKSTFFLQTMKHCTPNFDVLSVTVIFAVVGAIFILIGGLAFAKSQTLLDVMVPYGNSSDVPILLPTSKIDSSRPIYVYYHLYEFHQNVRFYVNSVNHKQLRGKSFADFGLNENCKPTNNPVDFPCGRIYASRFNDSFILSDTQTGAALALDKNVAWPSDLKQGKYYGPAFMALPDFQALAVWMRPAAFNVVDKLYAIIPAGEVSKLVQQATDASTGSDARTPVSLQASITNQYKWTTDKGLRLTQTSAYGGPGETRNVGILSLIVGCALVVVAILYLTLFLLIGYRSPRFWTAVDDYPMVTASTITLEELYENGDERTRQIIVETKRELGLI